MTMTEASASVPVVRIADKGMRAPVEIRGFRIGFGTSEEQEKTAWAEVEIYRLAAGGYLTHRIGYSLKYHTADTRCLTNRGQQKGDPATVDDLPDDAVPCEICRPAPPEYLGDEEQIRYEFPRHRFDGAETPAQVESHLTWYRNNDGTKSVSYSQPVRDALAQAAQNDEGFRLAGIDGTGSTATVHW